MSDDLRCYRCGESLADLTPPISRSDECPFCRRYLHVCRMCVNFDLSVPAQCREDDAEEVFEKEKSNFCDWYSPSPNAYDPRGKKLRDNAENVLAALFGGEKAADDGNDNASKKAEDLFR